jgi:SHS2 domain-containing protein
MLLLDMKQYKVIDVSGDAGIRAFGRDLEELFVNAAFGMYNLITDTAGIDAARAIDISVESDTLEGLLVSWLNELIFNFDVHGFVGKKIAIGELSQGGQPLILRASLAGGEFDPERHVRKLLVKAATYHRIRVEKKGDTWQGDVIFDI